MTSATACLHLEKVGLRGADDPDRPAAILQEVSLAIPAGRITALFGPSGGGKSSLLRLLNRLATPQTGRVLLEGRDIRQIDPRQLRRRVALVRQQPFMFEGTVLDNLRIPFAWQDRQAPAEDSAEVADVLARCQVPAELLTAQARQLSIGQQQRVALARALLLTPQVLLLDEPTSALDRPTADRLGETLRRLRRDGMTLVLVSHDLRQLERIGDLGVFLAGGRVVETGSLPEMLREPQTGQLRAFLAEPDREEAQ